MIPSKSTTGFVVSTNSQPGGGASLLVASLPPFIDDKESVVIKCACSIAPCCSYAAESPSMDVDLDAYYPKEQKPCLEVAEERVIGFRMAREGVV